jgi:hypothetical protein
MTDADLVHLEKFFGDYTQRFADTAGRLHPMQQLKAEHSRHVAATAALILAAEQWPELARRRGMACAWLHDIGRFAQFAEYGMFEDSKSINHATRGVTVLRTEGVLDALTPDTREIILVAVGCHNMRDLAPTLAAAHAPFVHLVRDADKLDIFRVFEDAVRADHLTKHPEIAWSLPVDGAVSPEVLAAVATGQTVSYQLVRTVCDFVMIQVGWISQQLYSDAALALACERGALAFRESFVLQIDNSPAVRACFAATHRTVEERLRLARPHRNEPKQPPKNTD